MASRLLSRSTLVTSLLRRSTSAPRNLHGIAPMSPLARETVGIPAAAKNFYVPRRDLHINEHSFRELAVDYGFTEFEPLYRVLRFIVVYRFIAEVLLS